MGREGRRWEGGTKAVIMGGKEGGREEGAGGERRVEGERGERREGNLREWKEQEEQRDEREARGSRGEKILDEIKSKHFNESVDQCQFGIKLNIVRVDYIKVSRVYTCILV